MYRVILILALVLLSGFEVQAQESNEEFKREQQAEKIVNDLQQRAMNQVDQGLHDKALMTLNQAIELHPEDAELFRERGQVKKKLKDYFGALVDFKACQKLNPNNADYHYLAASIYQKQKRIDEAAEAYSKAIALDTSKVNYFFNRGNCYLMLEQYIEAIDDFSSVLLLDKEHFSALNNRAYAKYSMEDLEGACEDWKVAADNGQASASNNAAIHCH